MPDFKGGKAVTPTGGWAWGINPASKNQALAEDFMKFGTLTTKGSLATTEKTGQVPTNLQAAAQFLPGLDSTAGAHSAGAGELIKYEISHTAVSRPLTVGYPQFQDITGDAFGDIRNGADPATRLAQANADLGRAWAALK